MTPRRTSYAALAILFTACHASAIGDPRYINMRHQIEKKASNEQRRTEEALRKVKASETSERIISHVENEGKDRLSSRTDGSVWGVLAENASATRTAFNMEPTSNYLSRIVEVSSAVERPSIRSLRNP